MKWEFCLATQMSPRDFDEMTIDDYNMATKVWKKMNSKKGGDTTTYG